MKNVHGILFDMDGVLVDSEKYLSEAAVLMFRELGLEVHQEDFLPFVGTGEQMYLGGVAEKYSFRLDIPKAKARLYEIYAQQAGKKLQPLPGVHAFIEKCRKKGLKMAVATSADDFKLQVNLRGIGLKPDTFDALVRGEDVDRKKPAPDIYLLAAERLGLTPAECLVIEDAPAGIEAGKAAGARVMALTTSFPQEKLKGADLIVQDLAHANGVLWK